MTLRQTLVAAVAALAFTGVAAHADGLRPIQGQSLDLGAVSGTAYYTVERHGFHVVATLAQQGEGATPVRVEALLAPGQSVTLSTPRAPGEAPEAVEISRQGDAVLVRKVAALAAATN
ncbi:MAG: hypothetical protein JO157_09945 [Acetobacteraceae bacterium]|nr:hypothetical protein [Acetobacteraceae bacterium]